jgi:hypothetical protein
MSASHPRISMFGRANPPAAVCNVFHIIVSPLSFAILGLACQNEIQLPQTESFCARVR